MRSPTEPKAAAPVYRRAGSAPRVVRDLVFDRLPPAVRDRLARGLANGAPDALLASPSGAGPLALRASLGGAVTAFVAVLFLLLRGLGDLYGAGSVQPISYAAAYGALLAALAALGGVFVALRRFQRGVPFRSGRYLFSLDLVEVDGGRLRVTSLDTLRDLEARARQASVIFEDGHTVVFPLPRHADHQALIVDVARSIHAAKALAYPADQAKLERLDPFFEVRITEDWGRAASTEDSGRSRAPAAIAAAALVAAPLGYGLLLARNAVSDDLMFEEAQTHRVGEDITPKLFKYASRGHRHLDEVARLLVGEAGEDRAQLRRYASRGGTLGALADGALFEQAKGDPVELSRYLARGGPHTAEADDALFAIVHRMDTVAAYNTTIAWKLHIEDNTEARMQVRTSDGNDRSRPSLIEDAFASFLDDVPGKIATSFHDKL